MEEVMKCENSKIDAWCANFFNRQLSALEVYYAKEGVTAKNGKDNLLGFKATAHDTKCMEQAVKQIKKYEKKMELAKKERYKKVYNQSSKRSIVNRVIEIFFNQDFIDECDTKHNLLGFDDGVIDLDTKEFRKAKPEDGEYITMSCGYKMEDVLKNPKKYLAKKEELEKILRDMWETETKYRLMMKALSRSLRGNGNKEEMAFFLKGLGS